MCILAEQAGLNPWDVWAILAEKIPVYRPAKASSVGPLVLSAAPVPGWGRAPRPGRGRGSGRGLHSVRPR